MSRLLVPEDTPKEEGSDQFEMEGWMDVAPFETLLNMEIREAFQGRACLIMPFPVKLAQGKGLLHGGALTALADTAVAMAMKSILPEGTAFATSELTMKFLAPVKKGQVEARARIEGPVGRSLFGFASIFDENGVLVSEFKGTFRIARGQGFYD